MFKRVLWWMTGAVMGVAGSTIAQRKVKRQLRATAERFTPPAVADRARKRLRRSALNLVDDVRDAIDDGRDAAADRQAELRDRIGGSVKQLRGTTDSSVIVQDHRASVTELHPGHPSGSRQSNPRQSSPRQAGSRESISRQATADEVGGTVKIGSFGNDATVTANGRAWLDRLRRRP